MNWLLDLFAPERGLVGADAYILWQIGRTVLAGNNPFSVHGSWYPPATTLLFSLLSLFDPAVSFLLLTSTSLAILVALKRKSALIWLLFWPIGLNIVFGNIDLLFLPLIAMLRRKDKWAGLAVALLFLKPQIALALVPWFAWQWLRHDRRLIAWAAVFATAIHVVLPTILRPTIWPEWIDIIAKAADHKRTMSAGIWISDAHLPVAILIATTLGLGAIALISDEKIGRYLFALVNPILSYYDMVIVADLASGWLLIPASLAAAFLASTIFRTLLPFWLVWIVPLAWELWTRRRKGSRGHSPAIVSRTVSVLEDDLGILYVKVWR